MVGLWFFYQLFWQVTSNYLEVLFFKNLNVAKSNNECTWWIISDWLAGSMVSFPSVSDLNKSCRPGSRKNNGHTLPSFNKHHELCSYSLFIMFLSCCLFFFFLALHVRYVHMLLVSQGRIMKLRLTVVYSRKLLRMPRQLVSCFIITGSVGNCFSIIVVWVAVLK